jgi:hypothetical protein
MSEGASMRLESSEFQETLKQLASMSERELSVFLNSRMLAIGKEARDQTPKSSKEQIEHDLMVSGYALRYTKKGDRLMKKSKGAAIFGGPRIYNIINAKRKKAGEKPIAGEEMATAAKKLLASRFRAVGALRSGWTRAIGIIGQAIGMEIDRSGPLIKQPSVASPAKPGWNPEVSLEYRETIQPAGGQKQIDPRVVAALESGFHKEQGEMEQHLAKKLEEIARKAGAL